MVAKRKRIIVPAISFIVGYLISLLIEIPNTLIGNGTNLVSVKATVAPVRGGGGGDDQNIASVRDVLEGSPRDADEIYPAGKGTRVILITPTYAYPNQIPNLTRMSNFVRQLRPSVLWIVVEDAPQRTPVVREVLEKRWICRGTGL